MRFTSLDFGPDNLSKSLNGETGTLHIRLEDFAGELEGLIKVDKPGFLGGTAYWNVDMRAVRGSITLDLDLAFVHRYVDGEVLPIVKVNDVQISMDGDLIKVGFEAQDDSWEMNLMAAVVKECASPLIVAVEAAITHTGDVVANYLIHGWVDDSRGGFGGGTIGHIPDLLAENTIQIPSDVYLDYSLISTTSFFASSAPRITGFFEGLIKGVNTD